MGSKMHLQRSLTPVRTQRSAINRKVKRKFTIDPEIEIEYRARNWGLNRIAVDTYCNYTGRDSGATKWGVSYRFEGDSVYRDFRTQRNSSTRVSEICVWDNGPGFASALLSIMYSTKDSAGINVGENGQGTKLVPCAALRHQIEMAIEANHWVAIPRRQPKPNGGGNIDYLVYDVTEYQDSIPGSRTRFFNPSKDLVEAFDALQRNVLELMPGVETLVTTNEAKRHLVEGAAEDLPQPAWAYQSRMVRLPKGIPNGIFGKGIRLFDLEEQGGKREFYDNASHVSYDLGVRDIPPDRNSLPKEVFQPWIAFLVSGCQRTDVIDEILRQNHASRYGANTLEAEALQSQRNHIEGRLSPRSGLRNLWAERFSQVFNRGDQIAILDGGKEENIEAGLLGYRPIELHHGLELFLKGQGIEDAFDVTRDVKIKPQWVSPHDWTPDERRFADLVRAFQKRTKRGQGMSNKPMSVWFYTDIKSTTGRICPKQPSKVLSRYDDGHPLAKGGNYAETALVGIDRKTFRENTLAENLGLFLQHWAAERGRGSSFDRNMIAELNDLLGLLLSEVF